MLLARSSKGATIYDDGMVDDKTTSAPIPPSLRIYLGDTERARNFTVHHLIDWLDHGAAIRAGRSIVDRSTTTSHRPLCFISSPSAPVRGRSSATDLRPLRKHRDRSARRRAFNRHQPTMGSRFAPAHISAAQ